MSGTRATVADPGRPARSRRRRRESRPLHTPRWRSLWAVLAEQQRRTIADSPRQLARRLGRALGLAVVAALLAAPFAAAWGAGHARVVDYLGPHRVVFTSNYSGEVAIDLGPFGSAYLASPAAPIGVRAEVRGTPVSDSLLSAQTLAAYAALYSEPDEAVRGIAERLVADAVGRAFVAELVLLGGAALWLLRRRLVAPALVGQITRRRVIGVWAAVTAVVIGSILAPAPTPTGRTTLPLAIGPYRHEVSVDSDLLARVLQSGIAGIRLLAARQERALDSYVAAARENLFAEHARLPAPRSGEVMVFGYSDLHCNQAMTRLMTDLVNFTRPAAVIGSGDDTVNGTAAERGCITREARIGSGVPMVVATGNHDSDVTEAQMRSAGMTVLDGAVVTVPATGLTVLGDDDPEQNIPFSVERLRDRPESEEQMAARLLAVAQPRPVTVLSVHQPAAARVLMAAPDVPARLVLWGHMHSAAGPTVVAHTDGSWTVGMQQGTAGGVRQPTFTSFSTPFSPPLVTADVYFYFVDAATGLVTAVQPVHFDPDASVRVDERSLTGRLEDVPLATRRKLGDPAATPSPEGSPGPSDAAPAGSGSVTAAPASTPASAASG